MNVPSDASAPTVAIINTSDDLLALLKEVVEGDGYHAVTAFTRDFRDGQRDIGAFITEHNPQVIIWDIAIPYDANWHYFRTVQGMDIVEGRAFVLTTTNKRALDELVGPTDTMELIGKPFDLDVLSQALADALARSGSGAT